MTGESQEFKSVKVESRSEQCVSRTNPFSRAPPYTRETRVRTYTPYTVKTCYVPEFHFGVSYVFVGSRQYSFVYNQESTAVQSSYRRVNALLLIKIIIKQELTGTGRVILFRKKKEKNNNFIINPPPIAEEYNLDTLSVAFVRDVVWHYTILLYIVK